MARSKQDKVTTTPTDTPEPRVPVGPKKERPKRGRPRKPGERYKKSNIPIRESLRAEIDRARQQIGLIEGGATITIADYFERAAMAFNKDVAARFDRYIKSKSK